MSTRVAELQQIIDYIEANLTKKIDLAMIGDAIHYSTFHLHHQFSRALGLTMHAYTQRRQLTEAAKSLAFTSRPIADIALTSGYSSQQAFHQAFRTMYKLPPGQFRANGRFYPLQWKYELGQDAPTSGETNPWRVTLAQEDDIPRWLGLTRLVVDGFPCLDEAELLRELRQHVATRQALIVQQDDRAIAALGFSRATGRIDFLAAHPLYRRSGVLQALLAALRGERLLGDEISVTTFRAGDKADTGQRQQVIDLGFTEAELLVEHGYPTQRFVQPAAATNG